VVKQVRLRSALCVSLVLVATSGCVPDAPELQMAAGGAGTGGSGGSDASSGAGGGGGSAASTEAGDATATGGSVGMDGTAGTDGGTASAGSAGTGGTSGSGGADASSGAGGGTGGGGAAGADGSDASGTAGIDAGADTGGPTGGTGGAGGGGGGSGGAGGSGGCSPETNKAFCSRLGKNCGSATANDNCGASRTVSSCATCASPRTCEGDICCTGCTPGTYETTACTVTADRVCNACTTCGAGTYKTGGCTGTTNTVCSVCTVCGSGEHETVPCAATTNRVCVPDADASVDATGDSADAGVSDTDACSTENDIAFCSRLGTTCGSVTANDNCGTSRTVTSCGTCTSPQVCGGNNVCVYVPTNAQSCVADAGAMLCNGESCCTSIVVPGGTFPQGRGTEDCGSVGCQAGTGNQGCPNGMECRPEEVPEFSSTVSAFALDKYEVTVGRFRKFVDAYVSNTASAPADGAGANPNITGSGWQSAWNSLLPATQAAFKDTSHLNWCGAQRFQTWTDNIGANEDKPINCMSWWEAFAFCIWDGGRLPTESEWEYAAAGGSENRLNPWGSAVADCTYANYYVSGTGTTYCGPGGTQAVVTVGSYPAGNGKWGHADLAGDLYEWTLDWFATYPAYAVTDFANISSGSERVLRGGAFDHPLQMLRAAYRGGMCPNCISGDRGIRCSRSAPACTAETDAAFCARLGKTCGSVTANDNCGTSRTVAPCGTCTAPLVCGSNDVCSAASPPAAPTGLSVDASDKFKIRITWNPAVSDGGAPETVSWKLDWTINGVAANASPIVLSVATTSYDLTEVIVNSTYVFTLKASNGFGDSSPASRSITSFSIPGHGGSPQAAIRDAWIEANGWLHAAWYVGSTSDAVAATAYKAFTSTTPQRPATGNNAVQSASSYYWMSAGFLVSNMEYLWGVGECAPDGGPADGTLLWPATLIPGPNMVGAITFTDPVAGSVKLDWTAVAGAAGYRCRWSTAAIKPTDNASAIPVATNTCTVTGLASGTTFYFWVESTGAAISGGAASAAGLPGAVFLNGSHVAP
jgi:formylglycine-generating enzyme